MLLDHNRRGGLRALLAALWLLFVVLGGSSAFEESRPVGIYRKIANRGFHRFLQTDIIFYKDALGFDRHLVESKCNWMLVEFFEASLYVDVYELRQPNYKQMYKFLLSNKVNTETAEYKSQKFQMYTYINKTNTINCNLTVEEYLEANEIDLGNSSSVELAGLANTDRLVANRDSRICLISFRIPVHARYHSPSNNGTQYYNVTLNSPKLYSSQCNLDNGLGGSKDAKTSGGAIIEMPCAIPFESKSEYLVAKHSKFRFANDTYCAWTNVEYDSLFESTSLRITVPVGEQGHELIIIVLTLVVLTFLALSLAKCLRKKVRSVKCYVNRGDKKDNQSKDQSESEPDDHISDEDLNAYRESFIQPSSHDETQPKSKSKAKK